MKYNILHKLPLLALLLTTLAAGILISCEGPTGPVGEEGTQIYAGEEAPSADIGANGDFYLNKNTAELYGPKSDDGWGTPISLQGPTDEDGSQIHAGTGPPDASLGVEGDYYLNEANYELYGPKAGSGWGTPISLKGTANVIYSEWIELERDEWSGVARNQWRWLQYEISAPRIDTNIVDQGVVLGYISFAFDEDDCCSFADPLPTIRDILSTRLKIRFQYYEGTIEIRMEHHPDATEIPEVPPESSKNNWFRYVIIPGGEQLKAKANTGHLPIDLNDYRQVKRYFGIPDE